jgi:hypothetical protein
MFLDMSQATTWTRLSAVTQQIAAKLIELREVRNKKGGRVGAHTLNDATASCPRQGGGDEERRTVGKGLASRDPIQRDASAEPVRRAMQASGGK